MQQSLVFNSRINLVGPEEDLYFKDLSGTLAFDEPELAFLIKNYLANNAVYFDIGANVGATALPIAKYLNQGCVYAFEPSYAFNYLEKNVKINSLDNVKLFNKALGEKEGEINFITNDCLSQSHCYTSSYFLNETQAEKIRISKLDDIVRRENPQKIDFIKINVEGYEKEVIQGCDFLIRKFNPIFYIRFNAWCLMAYKNENPRDFLCFLYEKFRNLYWIRNWSLHPLRTKEELMEFLNVNVTQKGCVDNLVCANRDIVALDKPEFLFYGSELPTEIGIKTGCSLTSPQDMAGCLSYGPYIRLLKGKYKVKIDLVSLNATHEEVGCWEVYMNQYNLLLKTGKIINSIGCSVKIEVNFEVTDEISNSLLEIKIHSYGNGTIELKSIAIGSLD